jgi:DNA-binding phage protein
MTKVEVFEIEDIKELVERAGSMYQLSKSTGLQQTQVSNFINGRTKPSLSSLLKLNQYKSQEVDNAVINTKTG